MAKVSTTTLKKNLERNLASEGEKERERRGRRSRRFVQFLAVLFSIVFPVSLLCFSANVSFRVADIYSFDLGRTEQLSDIDTPTERSEIADRIAGYLIHKDKNLSLETMLDGREKDLFSKNDKKLMKASRKVLDRSLIAFGISLVLSVLAYFALFRFGRKRMLRQISLASFGVSIAMLLSLVLVLCRDSARKGIMDFWGVHVGKSDMLPKLFDTGLFVEQLIVMTVICLIFLAITYSVTRAFTKTLDYF
jgi:hypothetical protein